MNQQLKRTEQISPSSKEDRTAASSTYPVSYLSPRSQTKRQANILRERIAIMKSLRNYRSHDVTLESGQNGDMTQVVNCITEKHQTDLDTVIQTINDNNRNTGALFQAAWHRDVVKRRSTALLEDQGRNGETTTSIKCHLMCGNCVCSTVTGRKSNRWSMMTYRLGMNKCLQTLHNSMHK